jgi:hypothetical protein
MLLLPPPCQRFPPAKRALPESSGLAITPVDRHSKNPAREGKKTDQRYIFDLLLAIYWARGYTICVTSTRLPVLKVCSTPRITSGGWQELEKAEAELAGKCGDTDGNDSVGDQEHHARPVCWPVGGSGNKHS